MKQADKGVVIMKKEYYVTKIAELLSDKETYTRLEKDINDKVIQKIKELTDKHNTKLADVEKEYLTKLNY